MKINHSILLTLFLLVGYLSSTSVYSQCVVTPSSGANCPRSNFFFGELLPNNGCEVFADYSPYSPGEYFRMPVLLGGCYSISTCSAGYDTQLTLYEGTNTATPFAWRDDSGPFCNTTRASITFMPNFTDYTRVDVRRFNCQAGGGGGASITVSVRQNNNLVITSSSADMCQGQSRNLTATPAKVIGTPQPGSGNVGTFSGTGVSGTTFTAPIPAGSSANYTITYTFGYCSKTQDITVYKNPSTSNAGPDQTVCASAATLAGNIPAVGTGMWTVVNGPGLITSPSSPTSGVTNLSSTTPTTFRWTITNGPCTASTDDVVITRDADPTTSNAGPDQSTCTDIATMAGNTPTVGSGMWSLVGGSGSITTASDPATGVTGLGFGPNTFRWTISNGVCPNSTDDVVITRNSLPVVTFTAPADLCINAGVQAGLSGGSPVNGAAPQDTSYYSGPGVTDDGNGMTYSFDPAAAGVGLHTITYTYIDDNGCSDVAMDNVEVFDVPVASYTAPSDLCIDAGVQTGLAGGVPVNGSMAQDTGYYSGAGVTNDLNGLTYSFDPAIAGVGIHTITYIYIDGNGCSGMAMDDIEVFALPAVSFSGGGTYCLNDAVQTGLSGGLPSNGAMAQDTSYYSGPGVTDDGNGMTYSFDPAAAGIGDHTITYTYFDGMCQDTATTMISVVGPGTNTWIGPSLGNWNDSDANWSRGFIPKACDDVLIPSGKDVTLLNGNGGICNTIEVQNGGDFHVEAGAILTVMDP